jgi:ABC transporter with metal-binding/Fe-S-binding domain ATP-binding protein
MIFMNAAVLFSGGKDSVFAAYQAINHDIKVSCLLTLLSTNIESYMFHTPSITKVEKQAELMNIPLLIRKTKGEKEKELIDLDHLIQYAKRNYHIEGVISGAVESAYQASRIQQICDRHGLDCFNPLWQKDQLELLLDIVNSDFDVIITGVFAYPLDQHWLGRHIDETFIEDVKNLQKRYKINPAGEGGEFESFVLNCPLFKKALTISAKKIRGKNHAWSMEVDVS